VYDTKGNFCAGTGVGRSVRSRSFAGVVLAVSLAIASVGSAACAETARPTRWIVYWSESPWPTIWAVGADGTRNHRILRNRQNAKRPTLSPHRAWIAFDGTPPGKPVLSDFDIQIVRLNGHDRQTLTHTPDWDTDAQWSPDRSRIAFTRSPPGPHDCTDCSIRIMRRDGSESRRIVSGGGARWSPDGRRLAYMSLDGRDLMMIGLDGDTPHVVLAAPGGTFQQPSGWSPDGRKILVTRQTDQSGRHGYVFVIDADGTGVRRLARGFAARWSSNGSKILYTTSFASALWVMNADGTHKHRIARTVVSASDPDWR
jgi:Tol biopolymer transport system component